MSLKNRLIVGVATGAVLAVGYPIIVPCMTGAIVGYSSFGITCWGIMGFTVGFATGDCEKSAEVITANMSHKKLESAIEKSKESANYNRVNNAFYKSQRDQHIEFRKLQPCYFK